MRLMISGDDFGMNEHCTRAIAAALREGLLTHTGMMATGAFFEEAAALARREGFADRVGAHLNLTEGTPLTDAVTAVTAFVRDGRFHKDYLRAPRPLTPAEQDAVCEELSAQLERLRRAGMAAVHADSHHYLHTFRHLAPLVAQVCRAYGVRRVRLNRTFDTPERPRITEGRMDNAWWREQGFETASRFGRMSDALSCAVLDDTEIMVHPDYDRNGVLIDRTGTENGIPVGEPLAALRTLLR